MKSGRVQAAQAYPATPPIYISILSSQSQPSPTSVEAFSWDAAVGNMNIPGTFPNSNAAVVYSSRPATEWAFPPRRWSSPASFSQQQGQQITTIAGGGDSFMGGFAHPCLFPTAQSIPAWTPKCELPPDMAGQTTSPHLYPAILMPMPPIVPSFPVNRHGGGSPLYSPSPMWDYFTPQVCSQTPRSMIHPGQGQEKGVNGAGVKDSTTVNMVPDQRTKNKKVSAPKINHRAKISDRQVKPKQPLSAYNFFFKEERERLRKQAPVLMSSCDDEKTKREQEEQHSSTSSSTIDKKTSNKHHGARFAITARLIAAKWSELDAESRTKYEELAAKDKARYSRERALFGSEM